MDLLLISCEYQNIHDIKDALAKKPFIKITEAFSIVQAKKIALSKSFDGIFLSLQITETDKTEDVYDFIKAMNKNIPDQIIVLATVKDITLIKKSLQYGVNDYLLINHFSDTKFNCIIDKIKNEKNKLKKQSLPSVETINYINGYVWGESPAATSLLKQIKQVACSQSPVLITGPTGSGKEIIARLIHFFGTSSDEPFLAVNCSAIPETLIESLLFGHEKGAFTGAVNKQEGYFSAVGKGCLFLDEIGELPLILQPKLLRVLENHRFYPIGTTREEKFSGRIIAATHKDLNQSICQNIFREDLYYRLAILEISAPPLCNRKEDIPAFMSHFFSKINHSPEITEMALKEFLNYNWPGNIRQLRNIIEKLAVFCETEQISYEDVINFIPRDTTINEKTLETLAEDICNIEGGNKIELIKNALINYALKKSRNNKSAAAKLLGVHRKYIERREIKRNTLFEELKKDYVRGESIMNSEHSFHNAAQIFQSALARLNEFGTDSHCLELKLELLIKYSICIAQTEGWNTEKVISLFFEARKLANKINQTNKLLFISHGIFTVLIRNGQFQNVITYANELILEGLRDNSSDLSIPAFLYLGKAYYFKGELQKIQKNINNFLAQYNNEKKFKAKEYDIYFDYLQLSCFQAYSSGHFNQCRKYIHTMFNYLDTDPTLFYSSETLAYGIIFEYNLMNFSQVIEYADKLLLLTKKLTDPLFYEIGKFFKGAALTRLGKQEQGLNLLLEGYDSIILKSGVKLLEPFFILVTAEISHYTGNHNRGLQLIEQGIALVEKQKSYLWLNLLLTIKGLIFEAQGNTLVGEQILQDAFNNAKKFYSYNIRMLVTVEHLSDIYIDSNRKQEAVELLTETLLYFNPDEDHPIICRLKEKLAEL